MAKILLVEDNEMNRDMLSRRLLRKGYAVVLAVDGGDGVQKAAADMPDLILLDMSLPFWTDGKPPGSSRHRPKPDPSQSLR